MRRLAFLLVLLGAAPATAADLPPGALVRLGDDRFRAGGPVDLLVLSPDGKQFAAAWASDRGYLTLSIGDSATGRPIREHRINGGIHGNGLFGGMVWGKAGAFAVFIRAEPQRGDTPAKVFPNDFRVWEFTDAKAAPPLLSAGFGGGGPLEAVDAERPENSPEYIDFQFSSDAKRVAALWRSADHKKHAIWVFEVKAANSAAKLKRVGTLELGAEEIAGFRVSDDGKTIVTFRPIENPGAQECTATVWDVATGTPAKPIRVSRSYPHLPQLMPNDHEIVEDVRTEKEWGYDLIELGTGKRRELSRSPHPIRKDADEPQDAAALSAADSVFLPDSNFLVQPGGSTTIVDLATGKEVGRVRGHGSTPTALAVSADGTRIATADSAGLIRLWEAKTFRALHDAPGHRSPVDYAQLSPDGKRVLTSAWDETIRLWDLETGKELRAFADVSSVPSLGGHKMQPTFTPDGVIVLYSTKGRLIARDLQTGLEVPLPGGMKKIPPRLAVFSPDGKSVLTWAVENYDDGVSEVWDWPSGKKRFSWKVKGGIAPGFSSDGTTIFHYATSPERLDAKTGKELPPAWKQRPDRYYELLSLRPNPRWLLEYSYSSEQRVIEAGTGKPVSRFHFTEGQGGYLAWNVDHALSPTGGQYASTRNHEAHDLYLFESATCTERRVLSGHRGEVRVLGFTPDGTKLLTAGGDHTVLVWDMRLAHVPLPEALKKETDAAKLWNTLATGNAKDAYLAMARLAREPDAAVRMAKLKLKPAAKTGGDTDASRLADSRAIELLEALDTADSRSLLKELAGGHADAFRTQEAKRALERLEIVKGKK